MIPYSKLLKAPSGTFVQDRYGNCYIKESNLGSMLVLRDVEMPPYFPAGIFTPESHTRHQFHIVTPENVIYG